MSDDDNIASNRYGVWVKDIDKAIRDNAPAINRFLAKAKPMSDLVKRLRSMAKGANKLSMFGDEEIMVEAADALEAYEAKLKVAVEVLEYHAMSALGYRAREALARIKEGK